MANWTGGSLREGAKIRNSQGGDQSLSKLVELGGNYRLFFRAFVDEIPVRDEDDNIVDTERVGNIRAAVVPGRTGDYEIIGTSFIPYTDDMYDRDEITGAPIDKTPLGDWARIARVLFEAQCTREKRNAEAEAERTAKDAEQQVDVVSLNRALEGIELKYHGGKAANGKDIMPDVSPAISSNIVFKISTRIALVKLNGQGVPDWKNAKYSVFEISKSRTDELITLLDNAQFFDMNTDYLEVGYSYVGTDKKEAGKNAKFQGIAKTMSLETMFPNEWNAIGKDFVRNIAVGMPQDQVDFMKSRNRAFKSGKTPSDAIQAYRKWCSTNQAVFTCINFDDEGLGRTAHLFLDNHLVDKMAKTKERFEKLAAENAAKKNASSTSSEATADETAAPAETADAGQETSSTQAAAYDEKATAEAMATFSAGTADTQTLRKIAEAADGLDIDDGDLGEI